MVAVDGAYNNWRHILLPFARHDLLVLQAVATVSSCHMYLVTSLRGEEEEDLTGESPRITFDSFPPRFHRMYQTILRSLHFDAGVGPHLTLDRKHSILMTILVLMVGTMVTGRSDFPILHRLLTSSVDAVGGEEALGATDVAYFIKSQIAK